MNRAERRRQEKKLSEAGRPSLPSSVQTLFTQAVAAHRAGQLQQAEHLYLQVLALVPSHADSLHFLGLLAYQVGRLDRARTLIGQALQLMPQHPHYWFNCGLVCQKQGRAAEAVEAYRRAITLKPQYPEAQNNLGNALRELGKLDKALAAYEKALSLNPRYVDARNNLGSAYRDLGQLERALQAYEQAVRVNPHHPEARNNLGMALRDAGRWDEAIEAYQTAVRVKPDYAKAHHNLGMTWLWKQALDLAIESFRKAAELTHNHGRQTAIGALYPSRIKHDAEQLEYLVTRGVLGPQHAAMVAGLRRLRERLSADRPVSGQVPLDHREWEAILPSFNRILHVAGCEAIAGGALNPALDVAAVEARYHARRPETTYVDDLLSPAALESLRTFCLESTIWKKDYDNGYIGAFLGEGFASPLLLQISEELRLRFPRIFEDHRLTQAWAFKYDSELTGLNIHADAAAVNVNFWITPDEANLDPEHGGLVVWDKEAPKEWNFREYN
ncbi:MAG: tetratricopeptide repeat protein, partial [Nitrospirales bacterium]